MGTARLYETEEQFAEMMMGRLSEELGVQVTQAAGEPLLLLVPLHPQPPDPWPQEQVQISLHDTYHTYRAGGDLNVAIDTLNNHLRLTRLLRERGEEALSQLDADYIYPAIRDERYVREAGGDIGLLSDPYLPGLRVIYLEIKDNCAKMIGNTHWPLNPRLNAAKVRRLAYRNLRMRGWQRPLVSDRSPHRPSCTLSAYMNETHPFSCQFLLPEMAAAHMPGNYVIAFPNRQIALTMASDEPMNTPHQALALAGKSRFREMVRRSFHLMPKRVSERLYWVRGGEAVLIDDPAAHPHIGMRESVRRRRAADTGT